MNVALIQVWVSPPREPISRSSKTALLYIAKAMHVAGQGLTFDEDKPRTAHLCCMNETIKKHSERIYQSTSRMASADFEFDDDIEQKVMKEKGEASLDKLSGKRSLADVHEDDFSMNESDEQREKKRYEYFLRTLGNYVKAYRLGLNRAPAPVVDIVNTFATLLEQYNQMNPLSGSGDSHSPSHISQS